MTTSDTRDPDTKPRTAKKTPKKTAKKTASKRASEKPDRDATEKRSRDGSNKRANEGAEKRSREDTKWPTEKRRRAADRKPSQDGAERETTPRRDDREESRRAPRAEVRRRPSATQVAARAARELLELTGKSVEGVTGLERDDDGWTVDVEVLEMRRIPDTTDLLALYEVRTDERGSLEGYRRVKRYTRAEIGDD